MANDNNELAALGISGVAKGGPGRAQACPNVCCALSLNNYIL